MSMIRREVEFDIKQNLEEIRNSTSISLKTLCLHSIIYSSLGRLILRLSSTSQEDMPMHVHTQFYDMTFN